MAELGTPGLTFGRVAEAYARTRPPYPRAAIERAAFELGLRAESTVLDLAAGTGKLTRALREVFASVVAVEPDPEMRAEFEGDVLPGTAEDSDVIDLHLTSSTPASIPEVERAEIAARAYPLMEGEYDLRVVTELYWKRFA